MGPKIFLLAIPIPKSLPCHSIHYRRSLVRFLSALCKEPHRYVISTTHITSPAVSPELAHRLWLLLLVAHRLGLPSVSTQPRHRLWLLLLVHQGDKMEGRFAEELYAESLQLSKLELRPSGVDDQQDKLHDCDGDDLSQDGSLWDDSDDKLDNSSDLNREWQRRHDEFHTIGYREGLLTGKEASAQDGFNVGFKQSVLAGYSWGAVRGVTSAFAFLPDELKEKLVGTQEKRNEFQALYESVHSLSTTDALRLYNEDIKAKEASEQSENVEATANTASLQEQTSHVSQLRIYHGQLESVIHEFPAIDIHLPEFE